MVLKLVRNLALLMVIPLTICFTCFTVVILFIIVETSIYKNENGRKFPEQVCNNVTTSKEIKTVACDEVNDLNNASNYFMGWNYSNSFEQIGEKKDLSIFGITKHDGMSGCIDGLYFQYKTFYPGNIDLACASELPKVLNWKENDSKIWLVFDHIKSGNGIILFELDKSTNVISYYLLPMPLDQLLIDKVELDLGNNTVVVYSKGKFVKTMEVSTQTKYDIKSNDFAAIGNFK